MRRLLLLPLVCLTACGGGPIYKPSTPPPPGPAPILLRTTMAQIEKQDHLEWRELNYLEIKAFSDGQTDYITVSMDLGYEQADWREGVLPALTWFVGVFEQNPSFGDTLIFKAYAPGWNLEDQTLPGETWTWTRAELGPYVACQTRANQHFTPQIKANLGLWAVTPCFKVLTKIAKKQY